MLSRLPCSLRRLIFFSFNCFGDHRDLHSFPTRRSSDLQGAFLPPDLAREAQGPGGFETRIFELLKFLERKSQQVGEEIGRSTRLNSSHTVISYAVFCLKKKKTKTRRMSVPAWRRT